MRKLNLSSSKALNILALVFILASILIAYFPSLTNDFVFWDDDVHLFENISVRILDVEHVGDIFKSTVNKIYIPLTIFSFAIEHHFFGYDPFVYHLNNLLLHLAVVGFIFWLGRRLGLSLTASGASAFLFGIHPIHVESVAWVTERKDVLYSFFYMAALLSYSRYLYFTKSTPSFQINKSYRFLVLTVIFGILSMLAKPMALSLPLILLLLDWFYGRKIGRAAIFEKVPLSVAIAGITWVSYVAHARIPGRNIVEGFLIWVWTFIFYLRQFVFPVISVPVYQLPQPIVIANPQYFLPVIALFLLTLAVIYLRKHRWLIFAVAFYFFSIFFLLRYDDAKDATIVAGRFMYLPSVGFCFLLGLGWTRLINSRRGRIAGIAVFLLIGFVFSVKTYRQCQIWHDSISLWEHQLKIFPNEPIALNNLAAALREQDEYKDAEEIYRKFVEIQKEGISIDPSDDLTQGIEKVDYIKSLYERAIKSDPYFMESHYNFGRYFKDLGKIPEAVEAYREALTLDPKYKDAHFSLGELYQEVGDYKQAIFAYDQTIALNSDDEDVYVEVISAYSKALNETPGNKAYEQARARAMDGFTLLTGGRGSRATTFYNLGYLYGEMGDFARAISAYQMALDINPNHSKALYNLGNIYKEQGQFNRALSIYKKVIQVDQRNSDAFLNMGTIYKKQGNEDEARDSFQKAIKADSGNARAYFGLGYMEEINGNFHKALDFYRKSEGLDQENKEVYYNLGNTYGRLGDNSKAIFSYLVPPEKRDFSFLFDHLFFDNAG